MLPLEGMQVLDLSQMLPGGLCTQILADLGADVIKIENPRGGDGFRSAPPLIGANGSFFHILNRNKKSMTLNIKTAVGRDIFRGMATTADVIIENARPGTMKEFGLAYEDIKGLNPKIIYCSLTGFGQTGPYRERPSHDINILAISGILDLLGEKGRPPIVPAIMISGAGGGGINAALGIMAALLRRERTGKGQYLDVSILDGLSPFLALMMSEYLATKKAPVRGESRLGGGHACYNIYETRDGKFIAIGCLEKKFWAELCRCLRREDLIDDLMSPLSRQTEMIQELKIIFLRKTREEWMMVLGQYDICFSPVNSLPEAMEDPQIKHRGMWFQTSHPADGDIPQQSFPVKFSQDQPVLMTPPPLLGEHTQEILQARGYDESAIESLRSNGVV
ncbi:MAG: CaiB/BaiF CoA-transferase family protein [Syntrophus sp. (in: bacteria)]